MLRKALFTIAVLGGLTLAACGNGPNDPMPMPGDDMMQTPTTVDTVSRR